MRRTRGARGFAVDSGYKHAAMGGSHTLRGVVGTRSSPVRPIIDYVLTLAQACTMASTGMGARLKFARYMRRRRLRSSFRGGFGGCGGRDFSNQELYADYSGPDESGGGGGLGRLSSGYGSAADAWYSQVYADGEPSQ